MVEKPDTIGILNPKRKRTEAKYKNKVNHPQLFPMYLQPFSFIFSTSAETGSQSFQKRLRSSVFDGWNFF